MERLLLATFALLSVFASTMSYRSEYFTSFLNISFLDEDRGVWHTEKTETGRFSSSSSVFDVSGVAVELVSNVTDKATNSTKLVYTACEGPFVESWPTDEPWIAVVRRGGCTFNRKVTNAAMLNASAVLVYDNETEGVLQRMRVDAGHAIPSVFTYNWKGRELTGLMAEHGTVRLRLEKGSLCRSEAVPIFNLSQMRPVAHYCSSLHDWENLKTLLMWDSNRTDASAGLGGEKRTSVLFVSVSFIVLMLISIAWLVFYYVQRFRYIHAKDRLERKLSSQAKRALAIISTNVLNKDDVDDACAVCIENYKVADVVRVLPCKHRFHKNCIDQWLLEKRTCPMCKMDILIHYGLIDEHFDSAEEDAIDMV